MSESSIPVYNPPASVSEVSHVKSLDDYRALYKKSIEDPDAFWTEEAERLKWVKKWDKLQEWDFHTAEIKWFLGSKINASYNCVDR
ncbi:MAG: acetyl-coenzyme A synthetase N-terminal domain-containing protein, partial [Verrucomicrobiia bacterium]